MPSPLASIYSKADSFKRSLLDMLTNPVESAQQIVGNANDRAGVLNQLTSEAAQESMAGDMMGPKSQQLAGQIADAYNPMGMMVFHGSPFKFDKFASKAIGSGEGAQAYGYGHYLAESPDVAKGYATNLANRDMANQGRLNPHANAQRLANLAGNAKYAADDVRFVLESNPDHAQKALLEETLKMLDSGAYKLPLTNSGSFYKVDLPDDQMAKMLDFDAELGKQTPEVQALAKQYGLNMDDLGGDLVARMNAKLPAGAESMRQSGITGIRYKDAQSRGGQQADTSNFVVFPGNEGLLSILERNEVSIPRGGLLEGKGFEAISSDAADIFGVGAKKVVYKDPYSGGLMQVLTRPGQPASVLGLEVPENFRNQGIAGRLQGQALKDFPNMQGQVSSKAAAKSAYKLGRRPVGRPDASLDDVLKAIDEDSSVNLVSPARQQEISGAEVGLLDADYRGSHSAPNAEFYGATLDDLTKIMPADVYSQEGKRLYGLGDRLVDSEWRIAALKTRGKPDAEIEVYRAVPKGVKDINSGDWVTTSKTYASQHGENTLDGDYEIIKKKVKAKTLSSEGYPYEFGYNQQ